MIPSGDAGIQLFVRNKHPAARRPPDKICCSCMAQTYRPDRVRSAIEGVDNDLIAARGYDVYSSTSEVTAARPGLWNEQPPAANKPIVSTKVRHTISRGCRLHP